ncbi:tRNA lysidine(34) synthetase TilS [Nitrosophilus alvini]|uniref:tRNA lysidine(34) synthetase TilS n=1 Tax=Nitrosophilus alvini TaxID=2714855 RepID=UPI001909431B|nr:tRNA lysidine(34) synthetase TilS [Nitrosophilus alvini]
MLNSDALNFLKNRKNLLAFSGGVDSTALFFLLMKEEVEFDIATVNYRLRAASDKEAEYAKTLAEKYGKKIFLKIAPLSPPSIEKKARDIRYTFFEEIIEKEGYDNLITAHQLNDQLEWFLMQLSRGAGLVEMVGLDTVSKRDSYTVVRPLLYTSKDELLCYLKENKIHYFIDESNLSLEYRRNYFRHRFSDPLVKEFQKGIKRSFEFLHVDKELLLKEKAILKINNLYIFKNPKDDTTAIRLIDKALKEMGYVMSHAQKKEVLKQRECVIAGRFAISLTEDFIYVSPFAKTKMDKEFKEECRKLGIPPNIRGYIYKEKIDIKQIVSILSI